MDKKGSSSEIDFWCIGDLLAFSGVPLGELWRFHQIDRTSPYGKPLGASVCAGGLRYRQPIAGDKCREIFRICNEEKSG